MRTKVTSLITLIILISWACQNSNSIAGSSSSDSISATKKYLAINCETCHAPAGEQSMRLAPPFLAIQKHYLEAYPQKEEFEKALIDFLESPKKEHALMQKAVEKYGLMPPMLISEEETQNLATFLFENEFRSGTVEPEADSSLERKVKELALSTKKVLGTNLLAALEKGGKEYALEICNLRALSLTDSMSSLLNTSISRISDKARNPQNRANAYQRKILSEYQAELDAGDELGVKFGQEENQKFAFYPILTNPMCLQCHGVSGESLDPDFEQHILSFYPEDSARAYGAGEIRGMWLIPLDSL